MGSHSVSKKAILIAVLATGILSYAPLAHAANSGTLGEVVSQGAYSFRGLKSIMSMIAYLAGGFLSVQSILKFKNHVDNPHQTPISDPVKRFLTGGLFLSLPFTARAVVGTLFGGQGSSISSGTGGQFSGGSGQGGLDDMVISFMNDMWGPVNFALYTFSMIAASGLLLVGISRLNKKMEEGPRGPGGMGTIMTFIASGALFSLSSSASVFSSSLFGDANVASNPLISSTVIADGKEQIESVLKALMGFVMLVGLVAFIRGWFVLKAFADGQSGATLAQGLTFLLGGTVAINLGDFVNALSNTLGLTALSFR